MCDEQALRAVELDPSTECNWKGKALGAPPPPWAKQHQRHVREATLSAATERAGAPVADENNNNNRRTARSSNQAAGSSHHHRRLMTPRGKEGLAPVGGNPRAYFEVARTEHELGRHTRAFAALVRA